MNNDRSRTSIADLLHMPHAPLDGGQLPHRTAMYKSLKWTPEREQALQRRTRAKLQARRPRQKKSEHVNSRTEARMQYREKKGLPGHVDLWLATKLAQSITDDIESPVTPDEVQCSVHVCRIPVCVVRKRAHLPYTYEHLRGTESGAGRILR